MSTVVVDDDDVSTCANCGKGEEESGKLKHCTACMMVKYCSRDCQIAHRPQHKKECRKRATELYDEELFKQPPSAEDCPICFLTLPLFKKGWRHFGCCGKVICSGCCHAPVYDEQGNKVDDEKCPFCRRTTPNTDEEMLEREKKRMELGDAIAIYNHGNYYSKGTKGYPQDYDKALELWHRAGELGYVEAYCSIGHTYDGGGGVEIDKKKAKYYFELAAMKGDMLARHNLGVKEAQKGNFERAIKHFMIGAKSGHNESMEKIQQLYSLGILSKDDYTKALRNYQAYLGEIKSVQRDKAAAADEDYHYY